MNLSGISLIAYVALWAVVIIQTFVLTEVLRQIGLLRLRVGDAPGALLAEGEGLERGTPAPVFSARELLSGATMTQAVYRGHMTLLVFLTTRCQACRTLIPELERIARRYTGKTQIIAVCSGPGDECPAFVREFDLSIPVLFDKGQQMNEAYRIRRTPSATLIDENGLVRIHGIPNDWRQLEGLLHEEGTVSGLSQENWIALGREDSEMIAKT